MPQRTHSHVIAERATTLVAKVFAEAGHAVETVANDYGEDLLVQTSHAGKMDASRLWIQVKGTGNMDRFRLRNGDLSLSVSFDHALRWARSLDLVVVVLCDVTSGHARYAMPIDQVDQWAADINGRRSVTLRFPDEDVLTPRSAGRLAWQSRLTHYTHLFLSARRSDELAEEEGGGEEGHLAHMLSWDLMKTIGVTEPSRKPGFYEVVPAVKEKFIRLFEYLSEPESDIDACRAAATQAAIIVSFDAARQTGCESGLPRLLAEYAAYGILNIFNVEEVLSRHEVDGDDASTSGRG